MKSTIHFILVALLLSAHSFGQAKENYSITKPDGAGLSTKGLR